MKGKVGKRMSGKEKLDILMPDRIGSSLYSINFGEGRGGGGGVVILCRGGVGKRSRGYLLTEIN